MAATAPTGPRGQRSGRAEGKGQKSDDPFGLWTLPSLPPPASFTPPPATNKGELPGRLMKNGDGVFYQSHFGQGKEKGEGRFGALVGIDAIDEQAIATAAGVG